MNFLFKIRVLYSNFFVQKSQNLKPTKIYRSFAKDNGSSQATANATNGGDANAVAKSNGKLFTFYFFAFKFKNAIL